MTKAGERDRPDSCWNRAEDDEPVFVLRARDKAAILAVLSWIRATLIMRPNEETGQQIHEAMVWCGDAADWRKGRGME